MTMTSSQSDKIEPMMHQGEVMEILQISRSTLWRRMRDEDFRRRIGAKRLANTGEWRFIRWRVELYSRTIAN